MKTIIQLFGFQRTKYLENLNDNGPSTTIGIFRMGTESIIITINEIYL